MLDISPGAKQEHVRNHLIDKGVFDTYGLIDYTTNEQGQLILEREIADIAIRKNITKDDIEPMINHGL